jgi:exodeoxyribonuclease V gamma subunit
VLDVTYSHRLEELVAGLADDLARRRDAGELDLFDTVTIVVPSRPVAVHVERALARAHGVAAGLRFPFLESFLTETAQAARPDARVIDRRLLSVLCARALADPALLARREMGLPAGYLGAPDGDRDRLRIELAHELAARFADYELGRPDWLAAWRRGEAAAVPATARRDEPWQRAVWRAVFGDGGLVARLGGGRWASAAALLEAAPADALGRLGRTALVGFGHLPPRYLALIDRLAAAAPGRVSLHLVNPCREFWDDVGEDPADAPLLALWGRPAREMVRLVGERTGYASDDRFPAAPPPTTALAALQADVLARARLEPGGGRAFAEPAIEILACPGIRRELEIIADRIWELVAADPTLRLDQIAVLVASNQRALYQAHVPSVLHERCGMPHHMIDLPLGRQSRVAEAVGLLLDLPLGALTRAELTAVLLHPAILGGVAGADGDAWLAWIDRLGMVRGADRADLAATYVDQDVFNWDQGLKRLALGAVMEGEKSGQLGAVAIGADRYLPEELTADDAIAAAGLIRLVRRLIAAAREARTPRPLLGWARYADRLVDELVHADGDADEHALARCRAAIRDLGDLDLDGEPVPWVVARQLVAGALDGLRGATGDLLHDGVLFAPLGHAPLPFRVVFVAGLGEGCFPGRDGGGGLDLRGGERRVGDLSARDRDLHALLDAVLGARERLVLSYVARDEKTGDRVGPSSALLDLADVVRGYHAGELEDVHPLRRHAERYFPAGADDAAPADPIGRRQARARAVRADLERHWRERGGPPPTEEALRRALPDADPALRALVGLEPIADGAGEARRELRLGALRRFLEDPVQAWAGAVLGVSEDEEDDGRALVDEPIERGNAASASLMREVVAAFLARGAGDLDALMWRYRERAGRMALAGRAPVGRLGAIQRAVDEETLAGLHAALVEIDAGAARAIAFGRAATGAVISERRPALVVPCGERAIELHGACQPYAAGAGLVAVINGARTGFRHLARAALELAALVAGGALPGGRHPISLIGGRIATERHVLALEPDEARGYLGALATELCAEAHAYLLPGDAAWRFVQGSSKPLAALIDDELTQAERRSWSAGPVARLERLAPPPDGEAIARRRLGWLLERLEPAA